LSGVIYLSQVRRSAELH